MLTLALYYFQGYSLATIKASYFLLNGYGLVQRLRLDT